MCSPENFSWLRNSASSGSPGWLSCVNLSICVKQLHVLSVRRRVQMVLQLDHKYRRFFFFHKEKCSSSRKLVRFAHFQTFICQPGLQRSSPARLIFPEKSIALQKSGAFVQPLKTLGLCFLPSVFSLVGSSTCFDKGWRILVGVGKGGGGGTIALCDIIKWLRIFLAKRTAGERSNGWTLLISKQFIVRQEILVENTEGQSVLCQCCKFIRKAIRTHQPP